MVSIKVKDKVYTLRYDMSVAEWLEDTDFVETVQEFRFELASRN